jgi:predicted MPP superfamily phosphohydrolase
MFLTDLHNKCYGKKNGRLLQSILEQRPDAILIGGDMITMSGKYKTQHALSLLQELARDFQIYYVKGNHEQRQSYTERDKAHSVDEYWRTLRELGIHFLENQSKQLEGTPIKLYGLELDRYYYKRGRCPKMASDYLTTMVGEPPAEGYHVLLAHHPAYLKQYAAWGADLVLSGHIHGGIVRIPGWRGILSPAVTFFPKYDGGLFTEGKTSMILSRGIGYHGIPFRLFNPNELVIVTFQGTSNDAGDDTNETSVCLEKNPHM